MNKIFILFSVFLLAACTEKPAPIAVKPTPVATAAPTAIPEELRTVGCPNNENGPFGMIHKLKNGAELWICGYGSLDKFHGGIFHKPKVSSLVRSVDDFGWTADWWGPLSTNYVKLELNEDTFSVTSFAHYSTGEVEKVETEVEYLPTLKTTYDCVTDSWRCKKTDTVECAWKPIKTKGNYIAVRKVLNGLSKTTKVYPGHIELYQVYVNALAGDQESLNFFLTTKDFPEIKPAEDEPMSKADERSEVNGTLSHLRQVFLDLKKAKCI